MYLQLPRALTVPNAKARLVLGRANVEPTHARRTVKLLLMPKVMQKMEK